MPMEESQPVAGFRVIHKQSVNYLNPHKYLGPMLLACDCELSCPSLNATAQGSLRSVPLE
jgi:hypothetical protein